jgi:hypothetical protein
MKLTIRLQLEPELRIRGDLPQCFNTPLWRGAYTQENFTFISSSSSNSNGSNSNNN